MQPLPGNPSVTHLLPFPLRREYRQESSVHGSPLNGAHGRFPIYQLTVILILGHPKWFPITEIGFDFRKT